MPTIILGKIVLHPVLALILAYVAVTVAHRLRPSKPDWKASRTLTATSLVCLGIYVCAAFIYLFTVPYFDHVEPQITSVAWNYVLGHPMFHDPDAAARYSNQYGPANYLIEASSLWIFHPGPFSAKLPFVCAGLAACGGMAYLPKRKVGMPASLYLSALLASSLLCFAPYSFWTRPDPFILLLVIASLGIMESPHHRSSAMAMGLVIGTSALFKAYSPIFFLLPLLVMGRRVGIAGMVLCFALAAVPPMIVFFLFPRISLGNHLHWLLLARNLGFSGHLFCYNVEWLVLYSIWPVATLFILRARLPRTVLSEWAVLVLTMGLTVLVASKNGAGPYYFIPVAPLLIWKAIDLYALLTHSFAHGEITARAQATNALILQVQMVAIVGLGLLGAFELAKFYVSTRHEWAVRADLIARMDEFSKAKIAVGDEGFYLPTFDYRRAFYYPEAVFRGNSLGLVTAAVLDMTNTRTPFPRATYDLLQNKYYNVWLFPASAQPFLGFPYPPKFHEVFLDNYRLKSSDGIYDTWVAR